MKHRAPVRKSKDRKVFKNTADKTKKVNLAPKIMRGGIRF